MPYRALCLGWGGYSTPALQKARIRHWAKTAFAPVLFTLRFYFRTDGKIA